MKESEGVCFYCGNEAHTIDHVVPWSQGGSMHPLNLVAACQVCNSIAGDRLFRDITDRIAYVQERRTHLEKLGIALDDPQAILSVLHYERGGSV